MCQRREELRQKKVYSGRCFRWLTGTSSTNVIHVHLCGNNSTKSSQSTMNMVNSREKKLSNDFQICQK